MRNRNIAACDGFLETREDPACLWRPFLIILHSSFIIYERPSTSGEQYDHNPIHTKLAAEQIAETSSAETQDRQQERSAANSDSGETEARPESFTGWISTPVAHLIRRRIRNINTTKGAANETSYSLPQPIALSQEL